MSNPQHSDIDDVNEERRAEGISTSVIIQVVFLTIFLVGIVAFVIQRRHRNKKLRNRRRVKHISEISGPNGLHRAGTIPPTYYEALKSPAVSATTFSSATCHQRQRSDEALMEQCWAAVYDAEEGGGGGRRNIHTPTMRTMSPYADRFSSSVHQNSPPASASRSVSHWAYSQSQRAPDTYANPYTSTASNNNNNNSNNIIISNLPVPPSPSYSPNNVVLSPPPPSRTMSSRQQQQRPSPVSTTTQLVASVPLFSPFQEPQLSARSFATSSTSGELSLRASIPESIIMPLQPAPATRRFSDEEQRRRRSSSHHDHLHLHRESVDSVEAYGAATWRTLTPHEDPPQYYPQRGNPDNVSPV